VTRRLWLQVRDAKEEGGGDVTPIPVTVRQLEALVRISESLARMELVTVVAERHVLAAIRLFHASTLDAVRSGMSQAVNLSDEQVWLCYVLRACTAFQRWVLGMMPTQSHAGALLSATTCAVHTSGGGIACWHRLLAAALQKQSWKCRDSVMLASWPVRFHVIATAQLAPHVVTCPGHLIGQLPPTV
jgi:hypothetical protein